MQDLVKSLCEDVNIGLNMVTESVAIDTKNNFQRKKELEKALKGKKYTQYIKVLNELLRDPKNSVLLIDGFGGDFSNLHFKFKEMNINVTKLMPTQNEIDVTKSIDYALKHPENLDNYFGHANGCEIKMPLITFDKIYVIDGHHRWSQMFAYNPDIKAVAYDYSNNEISPIQMLKATQGAIAATKADKTNDNDGELPQAIVEGQNLFSDSWDENAIKNHIIEVVKSAGTEEAIMKKMKKYKGDIIETFDDFVQYVTDNLLQLKGNNYPTMGAPGRGDMPQTDKGGTTDNGEGNIKPDDDGSALNRLKDGGIDKNAVK